VVVTYVVGPRPAPVPNIIANAATGFPGPVAPGEIITISGTSLGPSTGVSTAQTEGSVEKLLSDTQVTFDNIPAPLLFVSDTQIKTVVPYGIAGRSSTQMTVIYKNTFSAAVTLNVTDVSPGIFTNDSGQAIVYNEDSGTNGPDAPAAKGSVVVFFATGEGINNPLVADGTITPVDASALTTPVAQVAVSIGGVQAEVRYAGSAPGLVAGSFQVNVVIPGDAPSGNDVPVILTVGSVDSPAVPMSVQ
jgi:uncharacterized protein (TIGR03437 family)